jgi:ankyrin repeat protein
VDVDSKNAVGGTSLMVASIQGHLDMVCKFVGLVDKLQVNAEDVKATRP